MDSTEYSGSINADYDDAIVEDGYTKYRLIITDIEVVTMIGCQE